MIPILYLLFTVILCESYILWRDSVTRFLLQNFRWIIFPQAPETKIRIISIFFENLRRYSQVKVHHRYQWHRWRIFHRWKQHRWQIMGTISDCLHSKKKIYLYVKSTIQGVQTKYLKLSCLKIFPFATSGAPWAANISANFFKNSKRPWRDTQGFGGNWLMKNQSWKSRGTLPLKICIKRLLALMYDTMFL